MRSSFNIICSLSKWSLALMLGVVLSQTAVAAPGDIKTLAGGAAFDSPNGIHVTQSGDIYLADTFNHRLVKISANGAISTVAGNGVRGAAGDGGPAVAANLDGPINIAMDNAGNLYIADIPTATDWYTPGIRKIRKVDANGNISTVIAGTGSLGGNSCTRLATDTYFNNTLQQALLDPSGRLHVIANGLWRLEDNGTLTNRSDASCGNGSLQPGFMTGYFDASSGAFIYWDADTHLVFSTSDFQSSIIVGNNVGTSDVVFMHGGGAGYIIVANPKDNRVYRIASAGTTFNLAGTGTAGYSGDGGNAIDAQLNGPAAVFADPATQNVYIVDRGNNCIRKIDPMGKITTVAGALDTGATLPAASAPIRTPRGVFTDTSGNVYIADTYNHRIRKIDPTGMMTNIAGNGYGDYCGDGGQAVDACLFYPSGVFADPSGNVYIADTMNDRIRMIDTNGIISTITGTGFSGYLGDGGPSANAVLNAPTSIVMKSNGDLFISDSANNLVRTIDAFSGDIRILVNISQPHGLAVGPQDTLYASSRVSGVWQIIGGGGGLEHVYSCNDATGVAVDLANNLYMACPSDHKIMMSYGSYSLVTVAGTGSAGFSGDGGPAALAMLSSPWGVSTDAYGVLSVADAANNRVRGIESSTSFELTPPLTLASPAGGSYSAPVSVTLTCGDGLGSGCRQTLYCFGDGCVPNTQYAIPIPINFPTVLRFFSIDMAENHETTKQETYSITTPPFPDVTPPTGSITINSGLMTANTTTVALTVTCSDSESGCSQMQFSNDGITYTAPEPIANTKNWVLTSGDGPKQVLVMLRDNAGNWSAPIGAGITLDTQAPTGFMAINAAGWQISTIDRSGVEAGEFVSAAVDGQQNVHLSYIYHNGFTRILKYATNASGQWQADLVDGSENGEVNGNALTLDGTGKAHIAYTGGQWDLKYATNISGSWQTFAIESQGDVGRGPSIAVDGNDSVHVAYYSNTAEGVYVKYATNVSGQWQTFTINTAPYTTGASGYDRGTAISLDPSGAVHVCFVADGNVYYARNIGGLWDITMLCTSAVDPSMAIDANGIVHISYTHNGITYTNNGTGAWASEVVAAQGGLSQIAVDAGSKVHISYLGSSGRTSYATNSVGTWLIYPDIEGGVFNSIAVDGAKNVTVAYQGPNRELNIAQAAAGALENKAFTNTPTVTLLLAAQDFNGVAQMQFSNDGTSWSASEPYANRKSWPLDPGDGTKTVFTRFMDSVGNWSDAYSASIILDTVPPIVSIFTPTTGTTNNKTPVLSYTVSDGTVVVKVDGNVVAKVSGDALDALQDGQHTVRVESKDTAGNTGYAEVSFTVDTVAPIVTIFSPVSGVTNNTTPLLTYTADEGIVIVRVDGVVVQKVSGDTLNALADGSHTVRVESSDPAGNLGFAEVAFVVDTVPPAISINQVTTPTNVNTQTVTGTRESGAHVTFSLNTTATAGAVSYPTGTTWSCTINGLVEGTNTVTATATDAAGNSAPVAASIMYDSIAPAVVINSPSAVTTNNNKPALDYTAGDGIVIVKVDGNAVQKLSGDTLDQLADGGHTVRVEATDQAGNTGYAEVAFVVDTVPPTVTVNPVTSPTKVNTQTMGGNRESGALITVSVDTSATAGLVVYPTGTTWNSSVTGLVEGINNITITAKDGAQNITTITTSITYDSIAPAVTISSPVPGVTNNKTPLLNYAITGGTLSLVSVDGVIVSKTSGQSLDALADGSHTLRVEATDAAGNTGFAVAVFAVDTMAPAVAINAVSTPTNVSSQTLTGICEENAVVSVAVNTPASVGAISYLSATTWSCTVSNLATGSNTVTVTATDAAGNSATAIATITFDAIAPTVSITSPGGTPTNDNTPLLTYSASDGSVVVKVDGVVVSRVSGDSLDVLPDGTHIVLVQATDAAGNVGTAQVSFTVDTAPPAISIDPVTTPTKNSSQTITGTRESGASVSVTVNTSAAVGAVSYPSATTWSCTISNLVRGSNVITVRAVDAAGNDATATATIKKT